MLLTECGAMQKCEQPIGKIRRPVTLKIRAGSLSGRIEFNFSKLYYPRCFGEA